MTDYMTSDADLVRWIGHLAARYDDDTCAHFWDVVNDTNRDRLLLKAIGWMVKNPTSAARMLETASYNCNRDLAELYSGEPLDSSGETLLVLLDGEPVHKQDIVVSTAHVDENEKLIVHDQRLAGRKVLGSRPAHVDIANWAECWE